MPISLQIFFIILCGCKRIWKYMTGTAVEESIRGGINWRQLINFFAWDYQQLKKFIRHYPENIVLILSDNGSFFSLQWKSPSTIGREFFQVLVHAVLIHKDYYEHLICLLWRIILHLNIYEAKSGSYFKENTRKKNERCQPYQLPLKLIVTEILTLYLTFSHTNDGMRLFCLFMKFHIRKFRIQYQTNYISSKFRVTRSCFRPRISRWKFQAKTDSRWGL